MLQNDEDWTNLKCTKSPNFFPLWFYCKYTCSVQGGMIFFTSWYDFSPPKICLRILKTHYRASYAWFCHFMFNYQKKNSLSGNCFLWHIFCCFVRYVFLDKNFLSLTGNVFLWFEIFPVRRNIFLWQKTFLVIDYFPPWYEISSCHRKLLTDCRFEYHKPYELNKIGDDFLTLPLRGTDYVDSEAPPKKSMMEWAGTPCCYRHTVKV